MSVETAIEAAVTEIEETISEVEPRSHVAANDIRRRSNPVIRVMDETNPQDESLDKWFVVCDYYSAASAEGSTPEVTVYQFTPAWRVGDRLSNVRIPITRVAAVHALDYSRFGDLMKISEGGNNWGIVYPDYLPDELFHEGTRLSRLEWPHANRAFVEVVSISDDMETAQVRVFAYGAPEDTEYVERGVHPVPADNLRHISLMSEDNFKAQYAIAANVYKVGQLLEYPADGDLFVIDSLSYGSVKAKPIDYETGELTDSNSWGKHPQISVSDIGTGKAFIPVADNWDAFVAAKPSPELQEQLLALSKVTVAQALKHADRNDYCSETAVALASAGHSLPELRVKGTITLEVDISTKEYMVLRKLMGATDGRAEERLERMFSEDATAEDRELYKKLQYETSRSGRGKALPDLSGGNAKFDLKAELAWKAPRIRK